MALVTLLTKYHPPHFIDYSILNKNYKMHPWGQLKKVHFIYV